VKKWSEHIGSDVGRSISEDFCCPVCNLPLPPLIDRGRRSVMNMPFYEDTMAQRIISTMKDEISTGVKKYPDELHGLGGNKAEELLSDWFDRGAGSAMRECYEE